MSSNSTIAENKPKPTGPPAFRHLITRIATELLSDWVGEAVAGEAVGRIAAAMSSAAAAAKKPEDFYTCTPASVANCVAIGALTGIMPSTGAGALAYLIPRSPRRGEQKQLHFELSHRGLNAMAGRSGQTMIAIPVSYFDDVGITCDGEATIRNIDIDNPPTEYEEIRGVVIVVKRIESGITICRGWVPKKIIDKRRAESDSYNFAEKPGNDWAKDSDPWHKWPVEMAMKAAMHYAVNRGWCVIDDTSAVRAMASESSILITETMQNLPAPSESRSEDFRRRNAAYADSVDSNTPAAATDQPKRKRGRPKKTEAAPDPTPQAEQPKDEPPADEPQETTDGPLSAAEFNRIMTDYRSDIDAATTVRDIEQTRDTWMLQHHDRDLQEAFSAYADDCADEINAQQG